MSKAPVFPMEDESLKHRKDTDDITKVNRKPRQATYFNDKTRLFCKRLRKNLKLGEKHFTTQKRCKETF